MRHQCYQILHFVSIGIHLTNNNCNNFNKKLFCPSSCEPQRSVFGSVRHYHCICQVYTKHTLCQELCNSISSAHPLRYLFFFHHLSFTIAHLLWLNFFMLCLVQIICCYFRCLNWNQPFLYPASLTFFMVGKYTLEWTEFQTKMPNWISYCWSKWSNFIMLNRSHS